MSTLTKRANRYGRTLKRRNGQTDEPYLQKSFSFNKDKTLSYEQNDSLENVLEKVTINLLKQGIMGTLGCELYWYPTFYNLFSHSLDQNFWYFYQLLIVQFLLAILSIYRRVDFVYLHQGCTSIYHKQLDVCVQNIILAITLGIDPGRFKAIYLGDRCKYTLIM